MKKIRLALFLIIPSIFLVYGFQFERTRFGTDPESAYLLNGLNIARLQSVGHFDNPGTTVQIYSAVILRVTYFFRSTDNDLQTDVLLNSEIYIEILRKSIIVFNALILLLAGVFSFIFLRSIWPGLILQVAPFTSVTLIEECFTKVAPEPFLFAATLVLVGLMMSYQTKLFNNPAYKYVFALLAGFGLATKMTFLPVIFLPLFVLSNWRERWVYLLAIIPSFIIFTLPAAKGYPHMAMWFLNLGTHTGTYGQGESGIIDFGQYVKSLREIIWNNLPMSILALAGTALFIVYKYTRLKQNTENTMLASKYLAGILVVIALNILMVAKHYHSNHYLFPALSLCGYLVVTALSMFQSVTIDGQKWNKMLMPAALIGIIILSLFNITPLAVANEGYRLSNRSTIETENILATKYQDYTKIYYYPVSFNEMASLKWGNVYARQANNAKLRELFPKALFYFNQIKGFQLWETNITPEELLNNYGNKLLLVGGPLNEWELKQTENDGFRLTKIHEGRIQVIYQIDVAGSPIFATGNMQDKEKWHLEADLETLSTDNQWVVDSMGNKQFSAATLETGVSRSGKYAFCLKGKDTYALNYEIKDAGKGDKYRISVWRKGAVGEAFLVISGGNNYPLYIQKDDSFTSDNKGWQKISIDCKIPDDFNGSALKIYLWNNTNATVWFDDFTLTKY